MVKPRAALLALGLGVNLEFCPQKVINLRTKQVVAPKQQAAHDGRLVGNQFDGQLPEVSGVVVGQAPAGGPSGKKEKSKTRPAN